MNQFDRPPFVLHDPALARLQRAVVQAPATPSSDYDLVPELRAALPANRRLRAAAVLMPVQAQPRGLHVLLTRRSDQLRHHPGQVAFPGGKVDPGDATPLAAALRESHEEIGLLPTDVQILGAMPPHETVTGFIVTPFIGVVPPDFTPIPEFGEVDEVFAVPLAFLMNRANHRQQARVWNGRMRPYLVMPYGPWYIWGATARMIAALAAAYEGADDLAG